MMLMTSDDKLSRPQDMEELPPPAPMEPATQFKPGTHSPGKDGRRAGWQNLLGLLHNRHLKPGCHKKRSALSSTLAKVSVAWYFTRKGFATDLPMTVCYDGFFVSTMLTGDCSVLLWFENFCDPVGFPWPRLGSRLPMPEPGRWSGWMPWYHLQMFVGILLKSHWATCDAGRIALFGAWRWTSSHVGIAQPW